MMQGVLVRVLASKQTCLRFGGMMQGFLACVLASEQTVDCQDPNDIDEFDPNMYYYQRQEVSCSGSVGSSCHPPVHVVPSQSIARNLSSTRRSQTNVPEKILA